MKNIKMRYSIILIIICFLFSGQPHIYAQTSTTESQVEFTAGEGPTYPVDPDDPDTSVETDPPVTGSLAIVSVSDFDFGVIPVNAMGGLYDIKTAKPNIQVVDLRGSGTGWEVTASLSEFTNGESESLQGAVIHIYSGAASSLSNAPAPEQQRLALTADGTPKNVITAYTGEGTGLWVMRWYPNADDSAAYVQLEIPPGVATRGKHTATINWVLEDTPD